MRSLRFKHSDRTGKDPGIPPKLKPFKALGGKLSSLAWKGSLSIAVLASVLGVASGAWALRLGDSGSEVARLQSALGISVDGVYGPQTASAVANYQRYCGLLVDGIAGPQTLSTLYSGGCSAGGGFIGFQPPLNQQPDPGTGGCYNYCPPSGGGGLPFQPGEEEEGNNYVVAIPGNDPATLAQIRQAGFPAFLDSTRAGTFINAGQFGSHDEATTVSNRLKGLGFDARVDYRG